ncbi:MAG TPA: choice-of-anchor X domain-containing protein [Candidatus Nitrosopolaris sp.]|nr:choice-of-anchor X domain-containing protein [Candidatus Nitrosopolaris sp.]
MRGRRIIGRWRWTATLAATLGGALLGLGLAASAATPSFPIFAGDPIDPTTGQPYAILPGLPLLLPQPDGQFAPPIVDPSKQGDIDLVIRAGQVMVGPTIPPPIATPPTAVAGGVQLVAGSEIPFTVIASDGDPTTPYGHPLPGPELDGIPVIVGAFADLDGDGVIGPTNTDPAGDADNARELQESNFLVGRQVAIFENGVATGTIAVAEGAPLSAGGLRVILTAAAFVGPFDPAYFSGFVPNGPAVTTALPVLPGLDPNRIIEGRARGGTILPTVRLGVDLEPAFDPPVDDPVLGTPFALPTDGSSPTIDRATVYSGALSRFRFVRPSDAAGFPVGAPVSPAPLYRGAGGVLFEPLTTVDVPDDGPGGRRIVRLVPVDLLDNVTDPPPGATATLVAGPGLVIASPNVDGDPSRETVAITTAAGIELALDDTGGAGDSGVSSTLSVIMNQGIAETLAVNFVPGVSSPTQPTVRLAEIVGDPTSFVLRCPTPKKVVAVVEEPQGSVTRVTVDVALDGKPISTVDLQPGVAPPGMALPPGQVFSGVVPMAPPAQGLLTFSLVAEDAAGNRSDPVVRDLPAVTSAPPVVPRVSLTPSSVGAGAAQPLVIAAPVVDDCGATWVMAELDRGRGFRRLARLRDDGTRGDAVAGDGIFTGPARVRLRTPGTYRVRVVAQNAVGRSGASDPVELQVVAR